MTDVVCPACFTTNRVPAERLDESPKCGRCGAPLFDAKPLAVNATQFGKMIAASGIPVVVDFWAPWCGPCRVFAPVFEQAAAKLEPRARLIKLDTEAHPEAAAPYGIRSIPTLAIFQNGKETARQSGALPLNHLLDWVSARLG